MILLRNTIAQYLQVIRGRIRKVETFCWQIKNVCNDDIEDFLLESILIFR